MNSNIIPINVVSWATALRNNLCPGNYTIHFNEIPLGKIAATLDYKIWAKKIMAINCYFTSACLKKRFQLTVYCNFKNGTYRIPSSTINFATCPIKKDYDIEIKLGVGNRVTLVGANLH